MLTSLYIHFPYCLKKCLYCDFNSAAATADERAAYPSLLLKEMELRRAALPGPLQAPTLYFGGGTPSLMTPDQVGALVEAAARLFSLDSDAEITLEANPGTLTPERLAGFRAAGVNRLSLGVQSFEDRFLATLGRVHKAVEAVASFLAARDAGFDNIGIDLMHSLPGQSLKQWQATLERAIDLGPEHISAYALSVEEGTPFDELYRAGRLDLPDEDREAEMFEATVNTLEMAGYRHYEISNFARPGRQSRHNTAYWNRQSYLGFGAGAHSHWNPDGIGERWENRAEVAEYREALAAGRLPECQRDALSAEQALSECFFLGLRLLDGLDLAPLTERFGAALMAPHLPEVARLEKSGALIREGSRLRLSPGAVILANSVFSRFL